MRAHLSRATVVLWYNVPYIHVEFHAAQEALDDDTGLATSAHIFSVLIRLDPLHVLRARPSNTQTYTALQQQLVTIRLCLSRLAFLQDIVIESSQAPTTASVDMLVEHLSSIGTAEVWQRSCNEAHQFHSRARNSSASRVASGSHGRRPLLSPFWSLRRHHREWSDW